MLPPADRGGYFAVRDLVGGPTTTAEEGDIEIEYTGTSSVELLIPHDPGDVVYAMGYAPLSGVVLEDAEPDTAGWLPLPPRETISGSTGDTLVFELPLTGELDSAKRTYSAPVTKFKKHVYVKGTDHEVLVKQVEANVQLALDELTNAIPPARQVDIRTRMSATMPFTVVVPDNRTAYFWKSAPKYVPYQGIPPLFPIYNIVIPDDRLSSVAHECSHYMHHLLITDGYAAFAWNSRSGHTIGTPGAYTQLIEDFAYFGELYLTGTVSADNVRWGSTIARLHSDDEMHPKTTDFRDLEGMGVAILAALTRDTDPDP